MRTCVHNRKVTLFIGLATVYASCYISQDPDETFSGTLGSDTAPETNTIDTQYNTVKHYAVNNTSSVLLQHVVFY